MTDTDRLLEIVRERGIIRARELDTFGIARKHLTDALETGQLVRLSRGIYAEADVPVTPKILLAQVCKQIPSGVVCLISALQFHNLGTQTPSEIWIAVPGHSHRPTSDYPPIHLVEFSPTAYRLGIEYSEYKQTEIRVYSPAKTIVDCFRFRNSIGLDVALESLNDYLRKPGNTADELMEYAINCRISTVLKPYVEALQ
jgi:predicted transcriptional regulator of viral defense system